MKERNNCRELVGRTTHRPDPALSLFHQVIEKKRRRLYVTPEYRSWVPPRPLVLLAEASGLSVGRHLFPARIWARVVSRQKAGVEWGSQTKADFQAEAGGPLVPLLGDQPAPEAVAAPRSWRGWRTVVAREKVAFISPEPKAGDLRVGRESGPLTC